MLMSAMIFSRLITPDWIALGRAHDLVQHAVDAVAHPQVVLGRLEVDVRGAVLDRLGDQQVDVLDDRGVLDDLLDLGEVVVLVVGVDGRWSGRRGRCRRGSSGRSRASDVGAGGDAPGLTSMPVQRPDVVDARRRWRGRPWRRGACRPRSRSAARCAGGRPRPGTRPIAEPSTRVVGQVDEAQPDLRGERGHELGLGEHALVDEHPAEGSARRAGAPRTPPRAGSG